MANYTTNLNLEKPLQSENYDVDVFNANADKIDAFAGQVPARALTADKLTTGAKINGVNFKGDSDITLSTVNLSGNQTVNGVKTFSETIVGNAATATKATQDQNGDVINTTYVKNSIIHALANNSKGMYTGEVNNDAVIYKDIQDAFRSKFDSSKIVVTGNPYLTIDGIVTNTSFINQTAINIVRCKDVTLANLKDKSWEITSPKCYGTVNGAIYMSTIWDGTYGKLDVGLNSINFQFKTGTDDDISSAITLSASNIGGNSTDGVVAKITYDNYNGIYELLYDIGNGWVSAGTYAAITSNKQLNYILDVPTTAIVLGAGYNVTCNSLYDLKYVEIRLNDEDFYYTVFKGIDDVRPVDYTYDGTPTIKSDGIVYGFTSEGNVVKSSTLTFTPVSNLKFRTKFKAPEDITTTQFLVRLYNNATGSYITNALYIMNGSIQGFGADGVGSDSGKAVEAGKTYYAELEWTAEKGYYIVRGSSDGINWTSANITGATTPMQGGNTSLIIGQVAADNFARPFFGEIDLNETYIEVDGKIVWQACLKIPYNISKRGSKIAKGKYLDNVKNAYTFKKYAEYYTIDEDNRTFTLPMGEIYGMIESKQNIGGWCTSTPTTTSTASIDKPVVIKENYKNGSSWYVVYSDGFCVQGGEKTVEAQAIDATFTVNLLKNYGNTNYLVNTNFVADGTTAVMYYDYVAFVYDKTSSVLTIGTSVTGSNQPIINSLNWITYGYIS